MPLISKGFITNLDEQPILNVLSALGVKTFGASVEKQIQCLSSGHDDKNPSMSVNTASGAFYCQGCGAKGKGAIACYAMHANQESSTDFVSNIEHLSSLLGKSIEYQATDGPKETKQNKIFSVMLEAMKDFIQIPNKKDEFDAYRDFNKKRGLSPADQSTFKFGYVPKSWHLSRTANKHQETLIEIGLLKRDGNSGRIYSPLAGRVVFPINDERGRIIAMAGRDLTGKAKAKYRNTDTSIVFKKSRVLYGINEVLQSIKKENKGRKLESINVVEGYMDVIATHRNGFNNTVATMGTALTDEHLKMLSRHTDSITYIFDPDEAGKRASNRALIASLPYTGSMNFNFVELPLINDIKYDPDKFLKDFGAPAFSNALVVNTPIGNAAAKYIMGIDSPNSVYELMQNGMPQRAGEVYQLLPSGMIRPLVALEIAKVIGKKLDLPLTPYQLGMAFNESMTNKELTEELSQYRSGVKKEQAMGNTDRSRSEKQSETENYQSKNKERSEYKREGSPEKEETVYRVDNKRPPAKRLPFNTRFISSSTPQPGVMVFDDSGEIYTVTAIKQSSASLLNCKNKSSAEQPISNLVTLKPDRIMKSRFSNENTGLEEGDTILMFDKVYVHSLDPSWYEASMNVFLHPESIKDRAFLEGIAISDLVARKTTELDDVASAVHALKSLHIDELKDKIGINLLADTPTVVAKGFPPVQVNAAKASPISHHKDYMMPKGALVKDTPTAGGYVTHQDWKGGIGVVDSVSTNNSAVRIPGVHKPILCVNEELICVMPDRTIASFHNSKIAKKGDLIHKFKDVPWLSKLPESWANQAELEAKNKRGKARSIDEENAPSM
ncbi:MAG: toprim domain-containing protein [Colwellia sp.]